MSQPAVILCPGQGAQTVTMGHAWYEQSAAAQDIFQRADKVAGDRFGVPLSKCCFNGPVETLNKTDVCQPALYVTGVASYVALRKKLKSSEDDLQVIAAAGLSLGEYTALHIAGVFSFEDGLELVMARGRAMQDACDASKGSMVAVIGSDEPTATALAQEAAGPNGVLVPANFNAPGQIVLSGDADACERAVELAAKKDVRATPIVVAGAFHSPHMQPAADRMAEVLEKVTWNKPNFPVVSNVTALPHDENDLNSIQRLLVDQVVSPVRWEQSCQWLGEHVSGSYHEMAPAKVLSGLMRRINRQIKVVKHDKPDT